VNDPAILVLSTEGEVFLVRSIHTNGWADATSLVSGASGWLPTNYCNEYSPEEMRALSQALLDFCISCPQITATNKSGIGSAKDPKKSSKGCDSTRRYQLFKAGISYCTETRGSSTSSQDGPIIASIVDKVDKGFSTDIENVSCSGYCSGRC